jgi:menaquinone-specific isochorismate synthase
VTVQERSEVLSVRTYAVPDLGPLIPMLERNRPLLWQRRGFGIAGIGEAVRLEFRGPTRMTDAASAWRRLAAAATVIDPLSRAGTGLIALGSFTFADESAATSVLIVPSTVIGRDRTGSWVTHIGVGEPASEANGVPATIPFGDEFRLGLLPGAISGDDYREAVASAVSRIRNHELSKVVLARDLVGHLPVGADLRLAIATLALGYPDCWTFSVDGFVGSSPETLVSVDAGSVTARVLAGSAARGTDAASDQEAATGLATSAKDLDEHRYAVQSVLGSLAAHSPNVTASELPFTLKLPNLWHLASDVDGTLTDGSTSLDLLASLHPTAAVAGTPRADALKLIAELEPLDRGRYAGPVGWVGADGDGEWAVALRSAQVSPTGDLTAYAGAGIVAESDPARELLETKMKFRPIVEAFG